MNDNLLEIQSIINEHTAFCSVGPDALCAIDPDGVREQEIIERLFDAYKTMKREQDAPDEFWEEWYSLDDNDKFDTIVEENV